MPSGDIKNNNDTPGMSEFNSKSISDTAALLTELFNNLTSNINSIPQKFEATLDKSFSALYKKQSEAEKESEEILEKLSTANKKFAVEKIRAIEDEQERLRALKEFEAAQDEKNEEARRKFRDSAAKQRAAEIKRDAEQENLRYSRKIKNLSEEFSQTNLFTSKAHKEKEVAIISEHVKTLESLRDNHQEKLENINIELSTVEKGSLKELELQGQQQSLQEEISRIKKEAEEETLHLKEEQQKLDEISIDAWKLKISAFEKQGLSVQSLVKELENNIKDKQKQLDDLDVQIAGETDPEKKAKLQEDRNRKAAEIDESKSESLAALLNDLKETAHKERLSEIENKSTAEAISDRKKASEINEAEKKQQNKEDWAYLKTGQGLKDKTNEALTAALNKMTAALTNAIDNNLDSFYQYQAHVEARLQGSDVTYREALAKVRDVVGISGWVSQKDVIAKIKDLSDTGVAYNLEMRAFLASVSDKIANTFDVFDRNLLRMIRIQQADTTAARLGMEASLTTLFNKYFSDTSYLTDVFDSVTGAIFEASSQLTRDQSAAFEFMVQKWMGSLYSLGFSDSTISTIAQGLNYLGSGNVSSLTGNDTLNTLFAMSASKAGLPYADILTGGLDADTTNQLLKSMVEYLQTIANNTDNNQVVKSAYTQVFGLNMTDLRAIQNLSSTDIDSIFKESLTYDTMMDETERQLGLVSSRIPVSMMMDTLFENLMAGASINIGNTAAGIGTWKVLNVIKDLTGGIAIPAISVFGSGVDLNTTVIDLAKLGITGLSLMSSLLSGLFGGESSGNLTSLSSWDYDEYLTRGNGLIGISKGTASGTSASSLSKMAGSASSSDMKKTSLSDSTDSAEEDAKITNKNNKANKDIYEKIYSALAKDEGTISVLTESIKTNSLIESLLRPERVFFTAGTDVHAPLSQLKLVGSQDILSVDSTYIRTVINPLLSGFGIVGGITDFVSGIVGENTSTSTSTSNSESTSSSSTSSSASVVDRLTSVLSSVDVEHIRNLMAATTVGMVDVNNASEQPEPKENVVNVSLNNMSPEVSTYLAATIRTMVASTLLGDEFSSEDEDAQTSFISSLRNMLREQTLPVKVTNDNFDNALQKAAFTY